MDSTVNIQCDIEPTDATAGLALEIWVDTDKIFDQEISQALHFEHNIDDDVERDRELKFVLKNKTDLHTKIDDAGNIISDAMIEIKNLKFDDIELGYVFYTLAQYHHNQNGHSDWVNEKFYGHMGCNGTVSLKFANPVYLWLLENI